MVSRQRLLGFSFRRLLFTGQVQSSKLYRNVYICVCVCQCVLLLMSV